MSTHNDGPALIQLPALPASHEDWISYVSANQDKPLHELIAPYKAYDSKLREVFAQQPQHPAITKPHVVPLFSGQEYDVKVRARNLKAESKSERQRYLMPLSKTDRKKDGAPAVVQSIKEFQTNFQLFSESSLVDMDWSNVVVAGSAVVTSLLPVPEQYNTSKRALREYYHQKLAPASDVDLFLYDLTEEQALEKIKQIEQRIRDSILTETTTVRTKNAITIASQYPTRHVQIVLRIYRSISEILTGFDVDCSCAAYDGKQVYASPRALAAYMTQINTIDLTRRSPSYENRLSKYSRRGFEIYWPLLDRSRIDPTLFERSFGRTLGLARLLVLEKLPKNTDREAYVDQRRAERGRPAINRWAARKLKGNMKDDHDDEVAEWVETDEVSDYHTFTIPYGPKYHARKIERLLYAKDLLLNAEWNRPKDRETGLHRHPAFFGNATDILVDCCGYCPEPATSEEEEIAKDEAKIYVSGDLTFIKDDPGRQAIGSFNPLTNDDWTEMAYVGNTARLCQAIVDGDLEHVRDWLSQEGADPNRRDYTGRTPLHLAVMSSTPEVVQSLIDGGARIVARLVDGKTALHLAAMRGEAAMVRAILMKSEANEELEAEKAQAKKNADKATQEDHPLDDDTVNDKSSSEGDESETFSDHDEDDMLDDESENGDATTEGSIIKIDRKKPEEHEHMPDDGVDDDPDVYDVNVLAWDAPVSALHLAIANGHAEVVKVLVQDFGADILLPIKLLNDFNKSARAAILPIVLALQLSPEKAKETTKTLLDLGASPAQADIGHVTALHYFAAHGVELLRTMTSVNRPAAQRAVNHLSLSDYEFNPDAKSALQSAIQQGDAAGVDVLLELGAEPEIDFATYMVSFKTKWNATGDAEHNKQQFRQNFQQPIFTAIQCEMPSIVMKLLDSGANVNTLSKDAWRSVNQNYAYNGQVHSLLDMVREKIKDLREFVETGKAKNPSMFGNAGKRFPPLPLKDDDDYLRDLIPETYTHWSTKKQLQQAKLSYDQELEQYNTWVETQKEPEGTEEKKSAVKSLLTEFEALESRLVKDNSKTFTELYPDIKIQERQPYNYYGREPLPAKAWEPSISFQLPDLTDERRAAYTRLFQACWEADLATVKELTLAIWGDSQSPLQIAVQDSSNFSPYSIAVLRNHNDVAKAVLEIAHAQYVPEEKTGQAKHSLQQAHDDDESSNEDEDDVKIYSEIIDDRFTVENIGEVQSQVKSKVSPLKLMSWPCPVSRFLEDDDVSTTKTASWPFSWGGNRRYGQRSRGGRAPRKVLKDAANGRSYAVQSAPQQEIIADVIKPGTLFQLAILTEDAELLNFLVSMGEDFTRRKAGTSDRVAPTFFSLEEQDFLYAVRLGKTQLLQDIVKRTGAGIPLDDLIKKSGVHIPEAPKYYQGLSVHGKKRADWANAGRDTQCEPAGEQHPPLLHAARLASLESIEWFQSEAALRCYDEFADNNQEDVRIQNLAKVKGGLEKAITSWLGLRSHLLIHCVVLSKSSDESLDLLRQLCKMNPEGLQHRSSKGFTPLQLAFSLHRVEMIKVLLEAGADQTCRNNAGDNIVHSLLNTNFTTIDKDLPRISELLSLIDPRLLASLFIERTTDEPGAATPLARWLFTFLKPNPWGGDLNRQEPEQFVQAILQFSKGEDLGIVNSEGDTPLHAAVRYGADTVLRTMLECRPELLHRENATGRTPYEMAEDAYLANEVFNDPPSLTVGQDPYGRHQRRRWRRRAEQDTSSILAKKPESFVAPPEDERSAVDKVWMVCNEFAAKTQGTKRKLVSLVEANEVAKRLAFRKGRKSEEDAGGEEKVEEKEEELKGDEVDVWYNMGLHADRS